MRARTNLNRLWNFWRKNNYNAINFLKLIKIFKNIRAKTTNFSRLFNSLRKRILSCLKTKIILKEITKNSNFCKDCQNTKPKLLSWIKFWSNSKAKKLSMKKNISPLKIKFNNLKKKLNITKSKSKKDKKIDRPSYQINKSTKNWLRNQTKLLKNSKTRSMSSS